ncbi:phosphoribosylamine--glycine ligase [Thermosulfuriphilus sp.]
MKILVVGSGGREHALVWKLSQSSLVKKVYCAPGNAGIAQEAECVPIKATDIKALVSLAKKRRIDLTVVGPEQPLAEGIVDAFRRAGLSIFGPEQAAAKIEASKVFAKELMKKYGIPTADFVVFADPDEAIKYLRKVGAPVVVKAEGLAAGKGVIVCESLEAAEEAVDLIMRQKVFGEAGRRVVIEECLEGEEASFMVITDGETVYPLPSSQDHKRLLDGDQGPNTGGMGAYSPAPVINAELEERIMNEIMRPTIAALAQEGRPYVGVLYAGLMITSNGPKVLEFNCRFGDPECQPLMMRLNGDLAEAMVAALEGRLKEIELTWDERPAVCVVMASQGYPGKYETGKVIRGLAAAGRMKDVKVFHAGTARKGRRFITAGGRVLGVTALGKDIAEAISRTYQAVEKISWEGCYFRHDIGARALRRLRPPQVGIVLGSKSDLPVIEGAQKTLEELGLSYEVVVASAHRTPEKVREYATRAAARGLKVIIAVAGLAAHLPGVLAAQTELPVIGVPVAAALGGLDALLSIVQMPKGIPVATMAIGKSGAINAAVLAARIISLNDPEVAKRLADYRAKLAQG